MCIIDCLSTIVFILPLHLDYTKVIILILWWRNFQLEYWRTFQLVSTHLVLENVGNFQIRCKDSIVVLTLIAWAAIVTSASMVSYDLQVKNVAYSSTLL